MRSWSVSLRGFFSTHLPSPSVWLKPKLTFVDDHLRQATHCLQHLCVSLCIGRTAVHRRPYRQRARRLGHRHLNSLERHPAVWAVCVGPLQPQAPHPRTTYTKLRSFPAGAPRPREEKPLPKITQPGWCQEKSGLGVQGWGV